MLPGLTNRQWSLFLAASFLVIFSAVARAQLTNIQYTTTTSNGKITIDGLSATGSGPLVIPNTLTDPYTLQKLPVVSVSWLGSTSLTSVTIPSSVASIGNGAFMGYSSLTSITVSAQNSAYSSVDGVLFNHDRTTLIQYPMAKAGGYTIPSSVTSILGGSMGGAFFGCTKLTRVTIPNSVTSIGETAFYGCPSLTRVTISDSVASIGDLAFAGCTSLTSITVSAQNSAYSSVEGVLFNHDQTTLIQYPMAKAGDSYTIPSSVTSILGGSMEQGAFFDCTKLTRVTIPDSVTSIGDLAFAACTSLTSITVSAQNSAYSSVDGVLFNKGQSTLILYPVAKAGDSYTIPSSVTGIGGRAFDCTSLKSVTIPDSVTSIGYAAFVGCRGLASVTIPTSVTSIGGNAFSICTGLTSVTIPDSVTSIGNGAFAHCIRLASVTIPTSVTNIGGHAFSDCTSLKSVTIPDSVVSIGDSAFWGCSNLTSVTIPGSVTSIGEDTFEGCTKLTSAKFQGNAPTMGGGVFKETKRDFTVHYHNGATGFTSPTWEGFPSVDSIPNRH